MDNKKETKEDVWKGQSQKHNKKEIQMFNVSIHDMKVVDMFTWFKENRVRKRWIHQILLSKGMVRYKNITSSRALLSKSFKVGRVYSSFNIP